MNTQDWYEITGKVIEYRNSKGFFATKWDTLPVKLCCMHAEIGELETELDGYNDVKMRHEIADVAMYVLSVLHDLFGESWSVRGTYHSGAKRRSSSRDLTRPIQGEVTKAFEAWRRGLRNDVQISVELVLAALVDLRTRVLGFDGSIAADIESKIAAAADRPRLHGGKTPLS